MSHNLSEVPDDTKDGIDMVDLDKHDAHAEAILPESLRGLSDSERAAMEKKMVRKMDLIIL